MRKIQREIELECEVATKLPELRSKPTEPLPDLVSAGGTDNDASISSSNFSTLRVAHKSEGDMWANHPSVVIEPVQEEQAPYQIPVPPPSPAPNIVENDDMGPTLPPEGARSAEASKILPSL